MTDATYDLVLRGGRVIDPANDIDAVRDVAIREGRVAAVAETIEATGAARSIDVGGFIVTPGLIDIHLHAYWTRGLEPGNWRDSLDTDSHVIREGVTTCVDTGTAGHMEFEHFRTTVIDRAIGRILAYVNIAADGMGAAEQVVPGFDARAAADCARAHADVVVGIKTAHYWTTQPFDDDHPPWASVEKVVEAGILCAMPVMVDFYPRPPERPYPDLILEKLRPGDIHTHVFAHHFPVLDDDGRVCDYMHQARERGVHFDLGHGAGSFWFHTAVRALADGFPPDSISTDLHQSNIRGPVLSMPETMSKCLAMGMELTDVIYRSTVTPAAAIGRTELGTLTPGAEADIAVFDLHHGNFGFRDCGWAGLDGTERLECMLTLRAGEVVFDRDARTSPYWDEADDSYWKPGPVQRLWRNS